MKSLLKIVTALNIFLLTTGQLFAQDNVGIGTLTPNENAILDLTASNKGLLLPRMTAAERLSIPADSSANGLIVYDTDSSLFFYYDGNAIPGQWKPFPAPLSDGDWEISGNDMFSTKTGNVGIGTISPTAKLHTKGSVRFENLPDLTDAIDEKVLIVKNNGDVSYRTLSQEIWDGDDVDDADNVVGNEYITDVIYNPTSQLMTIIEGLNIIDSIYIPTNSGDIDPDPTNEIQNLSSSSNPIAGTVTVQIDKGGTDATFPINDADADPDNEKQALSISQAGNTISWNLTPGGNPTPGGSGSFNLDDNDWAGIGTDSLYTASPTASVGIGTPTPTTKLDVNGSIKSADKVYLTSNDYYIDNNGQDLYAYSANDMRFVTTSNASTGHEVRYYNSGGEAIVNFKLDTKDVMTMRGANARVGIGTTNPANTLHVAGDFRVGVLNTEASTNGGNNYGDLFYLSGGPGGGSGSGFDSDNSDPIFLSRYNAGSDQSELRIGIGDDYNENDNSKIDRLSIGSFNSISGGLVNSYQNLFDFEMENPGTSNGPMLSISPAGTNHVKTYNGALSITKPIAASGQFINLNKGTVSWSIGYQYGNSRFAISQGQTNDASFGTTSAPSFTINTSDRVGIGVYDAAFRLELPNIATPDGRGRANDWVTYSDGRFKKKRENVDEVLEKVMQMKPVTYQWEKYHFDKEGKIVAGGEIDKKRDIGFIAQDLYKLFPMVVYKPKDESKETWSVSYNKLSVILTKAIQEQQSMLEAERTAHDKTKQELEQLKAEVQNMKGRFSEFESKLENLTEAEGKAQR